MLLRCTTAIAAKFATASPGVDAVIPTRPKASDAYFPRCGRLEGTANSERQFSRIPRDLTLEDVTYFAEQYARIAVAGRVDDGDNEVALAVRTAHQKAGRYALTAATTSRARGAPIFDRWPHRGRTGSWWHAPKRR